MFSGYWIPLEFRGCGDAQVPESPHREQAGLEREHPGYIRRSRRNPGLWPLWPNAEALYPSIAEGVLFCRVWVGAYPAGGSCVKAVDEGKTSQLLEARSVSRTSPEPVRVVAEEATGHHRGSLTSTPGRPDQAEELVP